MRALRNAIAAIVSAVVLAFAFALVLAACAEGRGVAVSTAPPPVEPTWQSALDRSPEILAAFQPKALERDKVCGPLLRKALDLAAQHSRAASGTRLVDVIADSDEVIAQMSGDAVEGGGDSAAQPQHLVVVLIGVRPDIDPARLVDAEARALWSPGPYGPVPELTHERDADGTPNPTSLFELPNRTWVIATGDERARVRDAFAHPVRSPPPPVDQNALAMVRLDGPSLEAHVPMFRSAPMVSAVAHDLSSITAELHGLRGGIDGGVDDSLQADDLHAVLSYTDEPSAAAAQATLNMLIETLRRLRPDGLEWIGEATTSRTTTDVFVSVPHAMDRLAALLYEHSNGK
jgi:hypothetical protein